MSTLAYQRAILSPNLALYPDNSFLWITYVITFPGQHKLMGFFLPLVFSLWNSLTVCIVIVKIEKPEADEA